MSFNSGNRQVKTRWTEPSGFGGMENRYEGSSKDRVWEPMYVLTTTHPLPFY